MPLRIRIMFFYICSMAIKDHYHILGIPPGSNTTQIKKAFRKLALQYHPDKQNEIGNDGSKFIEIQEAYETLTDSIKREKYLYECWLSQSMGNKMESSLTAEGILQILIKTEQYLSQTDKFRLNSYALFNQMTFIFGKSRIRTIIESNNPDLIVSCNKIAIQIGSMLNSDCQIMFKDLLREITDYNKNISNQWESLIQKTKQKEKRETLKTVLILIASLLICLAFYLLSKS